MCSEIVAEWTTHVNRNDKIRDTKSVEYKVRAPSILVGVHVPFNTFVIRLLSFCNLWFMRYHPLLTLPRMSRSWENRKCVQMRLDHVTSFGRWSSVTTRDIMVKTMRSKKTTRTFASRTRASVRRRARSRFIHIPTYIHAYTHGGHRHLYMYLRPLGLVLLTMIKMFVYIWYNDSWIKCLL